MRAGLLGSEEQKRELLPRMAQLQLIGAWGLTEPSNGSDASALTSTARKARRRRRRMVSRACLESVVGSSTQGCAHAALGMHGRRSYSARNVFGVQGSQLATGAACRPCEAVAGGAASGACA